MTSPRTRLEIIGLSGIPLVQENDRLGSLLVDAATSCADGFQNDDVLVVAEKIISKSEGRFIDLENLQPSGEAQSIAEQTNKRPELVEAILRESKEVVRLGRNVIITEQNFGFVMANAGIDQSNLCQGEALALPIDPDASARALRRDLREQTGKDVAVIINDSIGRAWRNGTVGHALGVAGIQPIIDCRGKKDLAGRPLEVSEIAICDELAAAASLLMGQADEGIPAVLIRGFHPENDGKETIKQVLRPKEEDLFR